MKRHTLVPTQTMHPRLLHRLRQYFPDILVAHILTNPIKAVDSVRAQYNGYANDLPRHSKPSNLGVHYVRCVT